jgi:aminoglycoside phosphotransferase (APT) family kinase protein
VWEAALGGERVVARRSRRSEASLQWDADLDKLPERLRRLVCDVFAAAADAPVSLIHGDPGPPNIRIDGDHRVWLLDWDESRIDVSWHDLSNLGVRVLDPETHRRAELLSHAWETVNAWTAEPAYAIQRLDSLRSMLG